MLHPFVLLAGRHLPEGRSEEAGGLERSGR